MAFRIILKKSLIIALAAFMIILPQPGFSVFGADDTTQGKGRPLTVYYMCGQDDYTYEKYLNTGIIRDEGTGTIKVDLDDKDPFIWLGYYGQPTVELSDTEAAEIISTAQKHDDLPTYYLSLKQAGTATFNITIPGDEVYRTCYYTFKLVVSDGSSSGGQGGNGGTGGQGGTGSGSGSGSGNQGNTSGSGDSVGQAAGTASGAGNTSGQSTPKIAKNRTTNASTNSGKAVSFSAKAKPKLKCSKRMKRKNKLTWNKVAGASGYELFIKYPGSKKYVKALTKSASIKSVTHKGLSKGKTYRYKVRAFSLVNGVKNYGVFSKVLKVKVR